MLKFMALVIIASWVFVAVVLSLALIFLKSSLTGLTEVVKTNASVNCVED